MATEGEPKGALTGELESLRDEIVQLQSIFARPVGTLISAASHDPATPDTADNVKQTDCSPHFPDHIIDDAPLGMALLDQTGDVRKANRMFLHMLECPPENISTLNLSQIALEPDLFVTPIRQIFDGVYPAAKAEGEWRRRSGEVFWVQLTAAAAAAEIDTPPCCLVIIEDIGARKVVEQNLHSEKKLLEWIINSSVDGIVAFDSDGFFTIWNPAMERIFGVSAKVTLGRPVFLACPFFQDIGEDVNFAAALKGKKVLSKDGCYTPAGKDKPIWFEGYYGPVAEPASGRVIGGLAVIRDITDRRLAEEARRTSEERYRELFEHAGDMVYACNLDGAITSVNKTTERILGYSHEEIVSMNFTQLVAPEYRSIVRRMLDRQITDETPALRELELLTKTGGRIIMETSSRLLFREGKPCGIQGIARDISDRKKTEATLRETNKKLQNQVDEITQRYREMTMLGEMGDILRACITTDEIYDVIVRVSQELFPVEGGALFVIDQARNMVESVAEWGHVEGIDSVFTPDECWALRRGKIHWVDDTRTGLICKHLKNPPPKGYLCVPMMAQSNAVGMLHLSYADETQMPESRQRLALALAERIAMALANIRLHEILRNQSIRDPLTGLFHRNFMEEAVELEIRRTARTQGALSCIMLSIDRFRYLQEEYDRDITDTVLRKIGIMLQSNIRKGDIACRFNDHSFVVILPQTPGEVGLQRAEMFCTLAHGLEVTDKNGQTGNISISVGAAMFPEHGQNVDALLRAAENAVSQALSDGGNQVVAAG